MLACAFRFLITAIDVMMPRPQAIASLLRRPNESDWAVQVPLFASATTHSMLKLLQQCFQLKYDMLSAQAAPAARKAVYKELIALCSQ
jgi:hypothetical protein